MEVVRLYLKSLAVPYLPFHSDTLYGSLLWAFAKLGYDVEEVKDFKVSSAFPFYKDVYYFPNVVGNRGFLDLENFENLINGGEVEDCYCNYGFTAVDIPHPTVDRVTANTHLKYISGIKFDDNAGLYFLYEGDVDLEPALRLLSDFGIGKCKDKGFGQFKFEFDTTDLNLPKSDVYITLSLVLPNNVKNLIKWDFVKRVKKQYNIRFLMVKEGSLMHYDDGKLINLKDLLLDDVYINGRGFLLPFKFKEGEL